MPIPVPSFRKPTLLPLLFIIAATLMLAGMGAWQVERLRWKESLITDISAAQDKPMLHALPEQATDALYRKAMLHGTFLHEKSFYLIAPPRAGQAGYFVTTPLKLVGGGTVLVNRGWTPRGQESKPQGVQMVTGVIRPLREKRYFSPANDEQKNLWFFEDIPAMQRLSGETLAPVALETVGKYQANVYPIPGDGKISLRNDHLGYAITWFALAVIGLVMFAIYHRNPSTSPKE